MTAKPSAKWVKRYETRDDFAADTGPVVREHLDAADRKLYDGARTRAAVLLEQAEINQRDVVTELVCNGREVVITITRPGAKRATLKATVRA